MEKLKQEVTEIVGKAANNVGSMQALAANYFHGGLSFAVPAGLFDRHSDAINQVLAKHYPSGLYGVRDWDRNDPLVLGAKNRRLCAKLAVDMLISEMLVDHDSTPIGKIRIER